MTSSTSSSKDRINKTDPDDHVRFHARRVMAIKIIAFGGGALFAAMLLVNIFVTTLRAQFPNPFSVQRIQTSADALSSALELPASDQRKVVYVLGSSLIEFGFSPEIFDQRLQESGVESVSYNFGYGNADPSIHQRFVKRLAQTFSEKRDVIDLVVFEFSPFQATRRRAELTGQLDHAARAAMGTWRDFLEVAKDDHEAEGDEAERAVENGGVKGDVPPRSRVGHQVLPEAKAHQGAREGHDEQRDVKLAVLLRNEKMGEGERAEQADGATTDARRDGPDDPANGVPSE